MKRILLIHNIIAPYIIPTFNHLSEQPDVDLKVLFLAETEGSRKWNIYRNEIKFNYSVLKNRCLYIHSKEMPVYFNWGLGRVLRTFKPDAICFCGYHYLATIKTLIYAKIKRIPITLWAGSHLLSGFIKNKITDIYKSNIISRFDSYITYGTAATEQIIRYGANPERIITGCNTVDINWFKEKSDEIKEDDVKNLRTKYSNKNILYVGNFIEHKGVFNLIKAFEKLNTDNVGLILIGDGLEKKEYLKYIKNKNIKNIYIEGYMQKIDIVKYYRMANIFVLPSFNEVWGLVLNEAMACGLPVLSSKYAGATRDLVKNGINGYSFDPCEIDELKRKLEELLSDENKMKEMGKNSSEIIKQYTPERYAKNILEAVMINR